VHRSGAIQSLSLRAKAPRAYYSEPNTKCVISGPLVIRGGEFYRDRRQ
jgi:hypothetical protein